MQRGLCISLRVVYGGGGVGIQRVKGEDPEKQLNGGTGIDKT